MDVNENGMQLWETNADLWSLENAVRADIRSCNYDNNFNRLAYTLSSGKVILRARNDDGVAGGRERCDVGNGDSGTNGLGSSFFKDAHATSRFDVSFGNALWCGRHSDEATACCFSPDGSTVFTASRDASIKVWESATGNPLASLVCHTNALGCLSCTLIDGSLYVVGGDRTGRLVVLRAHARRQDEHSDEETMAKVAAQGGEINQPSGCLRPPSQPMLTSPG